MIFFNLDLGFESIKYDNVSGNLCEHLWKLDTTGWDVEFFVCSSHWETTS